MFSPSKPFPIEHLLLAFLTLQLLPFYPLSPTITCLIFFNLNYIKYRNEYFRFNYPIFFISQAILLYFPSHTIIKLSAIIITAIIANLFPVYPYPKTSGPYKVGYKSFNTSTNNQNFDLAIFYPTNEDNSLHNVPFDKHDLLSKRNYLNFKLMAGAFIAFLIPQFFCDLAHSFYKNIYLDVTKDAQISQPTHNHTFPVIVFSHGLGSYKHLYSVFFREWASHGFIVISVDHDEQLYYKWWAYKTFVAVRKPQLQVRIKQIQSVLSLIQDPKGVQALFGEPVSIDSQRIFLAGHSFGSATMASVALKEKEKVAGVVMFDPWMDPCGEEVYNEAIGKPVLVLRSKQFDGMKAIKNNVLNFVKANKELVFSGHYEGTSHNDVTDFCLVGAKKLKYLLGGDKEYREMKWRLHTGLVTIFMEVVCREKGKEDSEGVVEDVKRKLKEFLREMGKEKEFFYDV